MYFVVKIVLGATYPKIWSIYGLGLSAADMRNFWGSWGPLGDSSQTYCRVTGPKRAFGTRKSSCIRRVATISFPVLGRFWANKGCFFALNCSF